MDDHANLRLPERLPDILRATEAHGFLLASELQTGSLLRTLAGSKPRGRFLEIGTGTGVGTTWILDGMDADSHLLTIDRDTQVNAIARTYLGSDSRVQFYTGDAEEFLRTMGDGQYDFIFADASPGKLTLLEEALRGLAPGGLYVVDDLLPEATRPVAPQTGEDVAGHASHVLKHLEPGREAKLDALIAALESRDDLHLTKLNWASGIIIATKR
jgi:predicted O-methyltransferase YrrM